MRNAVVAFVTALLLAGCTSPVDEAADAPEPPSLPGIVVGPVENETAPAIIGPISRDLYFDASGGLSWDVPSAGAVTIGTPATAFVAPEDPSAFVSPPFTAAALFLPQTVKATLFIQSDAPLASSHVFDVAVWGGTSNAMPLFSYTTVNAASAPGSLHQVDLELTWPSPAGSFLRAGDSLRFLVMGPFTDGGQTQLLVGGETASRVNVTWQIYPEDPLADATETQRETLAGMVANGPSLGECDMAPGTTSQTHSLAISPDAEGLWLKLAATASAAPTKDLDFDLFVGGALVASSHTPGDREGIFLAAEALDSLRGQTAEVKVATCGHGEIEYEIAITEFVATP